MKNIFLILGSLVFTLMGLEIAFRLNPDWSLSYEAATIKRAPAKLLCADEQLVYRYCPGLHGEVEKVEFVMDYHINAQGFRDREHTLTADPQKIRVVGLGDSFMAGVGTLQAHNLASLIEEKSAGKIEFINMGVQGFGPFDALKTLQTKALTYHPDIVLMALNKGDLHDERVGPARFSFYQNGQAVRQRLAWLGPLKWPRPWTLSAFLYHNSAFTQGLVLRQMRRWPPADIGETVGRIQDHFRVMQKLATEHHFQLFVVMMPLVWDIESDHWTLFMDDMRKFFLAEKIAFIDPREKMQATQRKGLPTHWPMDYHFTPIGYEVVAETVWQAIHQ